MNSSLLSQNSSSLLLTSTLINRATTSRIPYREQVLIDAFNTYIQIGIGSVLFLFGLTFNSLSLLYFRASRSFRNTTFQLYFSIIAILDTIRLFEFFIFILFDKGYLHVTLQLCRWVFFTIMFTGQVLYFDFVSFDNELCSTRSNWRRVSNELDNECSLSFGDRHLSKLSTPISTVSEGLVVKPGSWKDQVMILEMKIFHWRSSFRV